MGVKAWTQIFAGRREERRKARALRKAQEPQLLEAWGIFFRWRIEDSPAPGSRPWGLYSRFYREGYTNTRMVAQALAHPAVLQSRWLQLHGHPVPDERFLLELKAAALAVPADLLVSLTVHPAIVFLWRTDTIPAWLLTVPEVWDPELRYPYTNEAPEGPES